MRERGDVLEPGEHMGDGEMSVQLLQGDCLELMKTLPSGSVDAVICDLPYGTTACSWDVVIPLEPLWTEYKRVVKPAGAIVLTASQPFTTALIASNMAMFKYCLVWEKGRASGFLHAKNKPLKAHEDIAIFSRASTVHESQSKERMTYWPQMGEGKPYIKINRSFSNGSLHHAPGKAEAAFLGTSQVSDGSRYPRSVIRFSQHNQGNIHPTQKPVALMEYLVRTYTNEGETVLDNTMGSGTTGVACINTNRRFIGMELREDYFNAAKARIEAAQQQQAFNLEAVPA